MRGTTGMGLIETMRVREGRLPLLERHLARLRRAVAELGLPAPDIPALDGVAAGLKDGVVRLEVRAGRAEVSTRAAGTASPVVIVATEPHAPYPHKSTERGVFDRALAEARGPGGGADDALLVTRDGIVAEGTAWSLCWWEAEGLVTPDVRIGILPGVGRARVMELVGVREAEVGVKALEGRSLLLVNAVRGIVPLASFQGQSVSKDRRTGELSRRFWAD